MTVTDTQEPITDESVVGASAAVSHNETKSSESKERGLADKVQRRASVICLIDSCVQGQVKETGQIDRLVSKAGRETNEVTAKCTTTLQLSAEVRTDQLREAGSKQRPGKVIVTDVTINSLTVTFKEAMTAEGFFSRDDLEV